MNNNRTWPAVLTAEQWAANPQPVVTEHQRGRPLPVATDELRAQYNSLKELSMRAGHILHMGSWPNTLYSPMVLWSCPCDSTAALPWYPDATGTGYERLVRFLTAKAEDESNPLRNRFRYC